MWGTGDGGEFDQAHEVDEQRVVAGCDSVALALYRIKADAG
jgi:hypothetical protein